MSTSCENHRRWSGEFALAPGLLVFRGRIADTPSHVHAAVQVFLVASGSVSVDGRTTDVASPGVIVASGRRHDVRAGPHAKGITAWVDPASPLGIGLVPRTGSGDGRSEDARAWLGTLSRPEVDGLISGSLDVALGRLHALLVVGAASTQSGEMGGPHPAVTEATRLVPGLIGSGDPAALTLTRVADQVHLSADRLGRLVNEQLGLPFAAYVRWARLRAALVAVAFEGRSFTDAAHAAGFSDSAHLSRVTREMFGMTPTDMRAAVA